MNYSNLIHKAEITTEDVDNIINLFTKGMKIYLLTKENSSNVLNNIKNRLKNMNESIYIEDYMRSLMISKLLNIITIEKFDYKFDNYRCLDGKINSKEFINYLANTDFNIEQYDTEHEDINSNIIVKAGAGTGKTATMIDRIMFLMHSGEKISFKEITMLTFTNKATTEMKNKLLNRIENYYEVTKNIKYLNWIDKVSSMEITTIHGFAKRLIVEYASKLGVSGKLRVRSLKYEKIKILEELIDEYRKNNWEKYDDFKSIPQYKIIKATLKIETILSNKAINYGNTDAINFGSSENKFKDFLCFLLSNLYEKLEKKKIEEDIMEPNDLIRNLRNLISEDLYKNTNTKFMFIDEFQDSDLVQVEFIVWFISKFNISSFVVGDVKQSIYRFRGAEYTAFEQLEKELLKPTINKKIKKKVLKKNYRTDEKILEEINEIFMLAGDNVESFEFNRSDNLNAMKYYSDSENIRYETFGDVVFIEKIREIVNRISKDNSKTEPQNAAILVRSNSEVEKILKLFDDTEIQCSAEREGDFYRHIVVRELYILIKAIMHPSVAINQYALLNSSYFFDGISNYEIINNFTTKKDYLLEYAKEKTNNFVQYIRNKMDKEPILDVLREVILMSNPSENYAKSEYIRISNKSDEEKLAKKCDFMCMDYEINLNHMMYILENKFSDKSTTIFDIEFFIKNKMATDFIENRQAIDNKNKHYELTCMTIHKAKGLEFDYVIMPKLDGRFVKNGEIDVIIEEISGILSIGFNVSVENRIFENSIYNEMNRKERKEVIGEETRLFYVALTRAKRNLLLNTDGNSGRSMIGCFNDIVGSRGI